MESILTSIKKMLGIEESDTSFDVDVIAHINTALMALTQLGVGPQEGMMITGATETWGQFLDISKFAGVKTFVFLKAKLAFDPSQTSFVIDSCNRQIEELAWRLMILADPPPPIPLEEE